MSSTNVSGLIRITKWLPALAWAALIFRFSSLPPSDVPGRFATLAHFVEYAVLALLVLWPLSARLGATAPLAAFAISSLYGITDEIHQAFVPGRVPDVLDWLADSAGAATAMVVAVLVAAALRRAAIRRPFS